MQELDQWCHGLGTTEAHSNLLSLTQHLELELVVIPTECCVVGGMESWVNCPHLSSLLAVLLHEILQLSAIQCLSGLALGGNEEWLFAFCSASIAWGTRPESLPGESTWFLQGLCPAESGTGRL